jgi:hypothetical protein
VLLAVAGPLPRSADATTIGGSGSTLTLTGNILRNEIFIRAEFPGEWVLFAGDSPNDVFNFEAGSGACPSIVNQGKRADCPDRPFTLFRFDLKASDDKVTGAILSTAAPMRLPRVVLDAGTGDDLIVLPEESSAGDQLIGGAGEDTMDTVDGLADSVSCGTGRDSVTVDLKDAVTSDCNNVSRAPVDQHPTVRIGARSLTLGASGLVSIRLSCPRVLRRACKGQLALESARGRTFARSAYEIRAGRSRVVELRPSRNAARSLRQARSVRAVARERDPQGRPKTTIATLR